MKGYGNKDRHFDVIIIFYIFETKISSCQLHSMIKFTCLVIWLVCSAVVSAQTSPHIARHEVKLGIGAFPLLSGGINGNYGLYEDDNWKALDLLDRDCHGDLHTTGCIFGSYGYRLLKWLKLGISTSYVHFWRKYPSGEESSSYMGVLPFAELAWLNKKFFRMYSAIAIGINIAVIRDSGISKKDFDSEAGVQLTYLGLSVGNKWFGFAELGVGNRGLVSAGLGYRF